MKILFDLDGTILDSSERLYRLFCELIPDCTFTKEDYWNLKRNKINHKMILEKYFSEYDFNEFNTKWLKLIEDEKYLKSDKLYDFTIPLLKSINNDIFLITARQSRKNLLEELEWFGIKEYFKDIYVTENKIENVDILRNLHITSEDILVSDMGKDILAGKEVGIKTVGVSWGFMNEEKLKEYKPDFIVSDYNEIIKIISKGVMYAR